MKKLLLGPTATLATTATAADAHGYPRPYPDRSVDGHERPARRPHHGCGRVAYTCTAARYTVCLLSRPARTGASCDCSCRDGGKREG